MDRVTIQKDIRQLQNTLANLLEILPRVTRALEALTVELDRAAADGDPQGELFGPQEGGTIE